MSWRLRNSRYLTSSSRRLVGYLLFLSVITYSGVIIVNEASNRRFLRRVLGVFGEQSSLYRTSDGCDARSEHMTCFPRTTISSHCLTAAYVVLRPRRSACCTTATDDGLMRFRPRELARLRAEEDAARARRSRETITYSIVLSIEPTAPSKRRD